MAYQMVATVVTLNRRACASHKYIITSLGAIVHYTEDYL